MRRGILVLAVAAGAGVGGVHARGQDAPGGEPAAALRAGKPGPATAVVMLDRGTITAAQRLTVTLRVTLPEGAGAELPPRADKLGEFTVVRAIEAPPRLTPEGGLTLERTYILEPFLPGDYTVPAFEIATRTPGSAEPAVVRTQPVTVKVTSLLPEGETPADLGPIRPVVDPPGAARPAWVVPAAVAGSAVCLAGLGFAAVRLRRRARGPEVSLVQTAIGRLHRLTATLSPGTEPAGACDEIVLLVRMALAEAVEPRAGSLTAEELVAAAPAWAGFGAEGAERLRRVLSSCDAARFGGVPISAERLHAVAHDALAIVESLRAGEGARGGAS